MSASELKAHHVWDAPTRWFHWINVVCVIGLAAIGTAILYDSQLGITNDGKILLKTTHVWIGYVFVLNLVWRLLWAFIGNRHARWSAILPFRRGYGTELKSYLGGMIRGNARPYLGHNPVARAMVTALLVLLVLQAATGLILAGTDIYYPPFGHWIASWVAAPGVDPASLAPYDKTGIDPTAWTDMRAFRAPVISTHLWSFYALLAVVAIHILGVVVTEMREGGAIVSAMFTGKKVIDREPADGPDTGQ